MADRHILENVQLCISSYPCNDAGTYFVPDFVAVKFMKVNGINTFDIVVVDTKLSKGTGYTENQKRAMNSSSYFMRSVDKKITLPNGEIIQLPPNTPISKTGDFLKAYSDGNGVFQDID